MWCVSACVGLLLLGFGLTAADAGTSDEGYCNTTGLGTPLISAERDLHTCLLKKYNKWARPVTNYSNTVHVHIDILYMRVIDLHEKEQMLEFEALIVQAWTDPQLKWDSDKYGGVKQLRMPVSEVWTPGIILYNNAMPYQHLSDQNQLVVVFANGTVVWVPMVRTKAYCRLELRRYPFDTQHCAIIYGIWTYDTTQVKLNLAPGAGPEFEFPHKTWETVVTKKQSAYKYWDKEYSMVTFSVKMMRLVNFQQVVMVGPAVLIAALLLLIFWIPPASSERVHLGVGCIIVTTLLFIIMDTYIPTEITSTPIIGMYMFFVFFMACAALALSTVVMRCYHRDMSSTNVPRWMRAFFLSFLGRLVCVRPASYMSVPSDVAVVNPGREMLSPHDVNLNEDQPLPRSPTLALEKVLDEIRLYLKMLAMRDAQSVPVITSHKENVVSEWHQVAIVIDRLLFIVFLVVTIIVTIAMLSH